MLPHLSEIEVFIQHFLANVFSLGCGVFLTENRRDVILFFATLFFVCTRKL